jgi:hypothetical protein
MQLNFGAELEREKAAQRSLDALLRKAAKGFSAGGACYGYDLMPCYAKNGNGERTRSHTDFAINEEQAETIRAIFRAYADGHGHTTIAKALNRDLEARGPKGERRRMLRSDLEIVRKRYFDGCNTASPQRGKRGTGSWGPSCIREILYRQPYSGRIPIRGEIDGPPRSANR